MTTLTDLRDKMIAEAMQLLKDAAEPADRLDRFKAVSAFYAAAMKVSGKAGGGDSADTKTFGDVIKKLGIGGPVRSNGETQ